MRLRNKLNVKQVAALSRPGVHADGGGLYVRVRDSGSKSWLYIGMVNGKRREVGLGSVFDVTLQAARARTDELRASCREGRDPVVDRKRARVAQRPSTTFGAFSESLIEDIEEGFRNDKHRKQWRSTLQNHAAALRDRSVDTIKAEDILEVLKPIWLTIPETASRVRGRIERVLDAAKAKGLRTGENPARWKGHLELLLPRKQKVQQGHHAALPFTEIASFMKELATRPATAARALEFTILTAARSGEALGLTWSEINFDQAIWTVPGERMKAGVQHQVPLSQRALTLLHRLKGDNAGATSYVFVSERKQPLSNMAMSMLLRRMEQGSITVHGFRSTFRDWAGEMTSFPREDIEMALAHTIGSKAERAYRRGKALEKRRELMAAWASFCDLLPGCNE